MTTTTAMPLGATPTGAAPADPVVLAHHNASFLAVWENDGISFYSDGVDWLAGNEPAHYLPLPGCPPDAGLLRAAVADRLAGVAPEVSARRLARACLDARTAPDFRPAPTFRDVAVRAKELSGNVQVTFTDTGRAVASTNGAGSTEMITVRDRECHANVHLERVDGTWRVSQTVAYHIKRGPHGEPMPPTFTARVLAAVTEAAQTLWTPEIDAEAAYAAAQRRLHVLHDQRVQAERALAEVVAEQRRWQAVRPPAEVPDTDTAGTDTRTP